MNRIDEIIKEQDDKNYKIELFLYALLDLLQSVADIDIDEDGVPPRDGTPS